MLVIVPVTCDRVCVMQQVPRLHYMVAISVARYHNLTQKEGVSVLQYIRR